jgi:hypothetical protein
MEDIRHLPRVATIATMRSRLESFRMVFQIVRPQVEHVFVYLDGYDNPPSFLKGLAGVSVHRAEDVGNMHAASRLLCLRELTSPSVVAIVDDDILYPPDYVERLTRALQRFRGNALVGVHGRVFTPPHRSYVRDAVPLYFGIKLERAQSVHELGTGTCAFVSNRLPLDPRGWDRFDMSDITVAIEAQKRGLPRIAIARPAGWMRPIELGQDDSIWSRTQKDETEHIRRMKFLLGLYASSEGEDATRQRSSWGEGKESEAGVKAALETGREC